MPKRKTAADLHHPLDDLDTVPLEEFKAWFHGLSKEDRSFGQLNLQKAWDLRWAGTTALESQAERDERYDARNRLVMASVVTGVPMVHDWRALCGLDALYEQMEEEGW